MLWINAKCWRCPQCRGPGGAFLFRSAELEDENEAIAAAAWQDKFSEEIPAPLVGTRIRKIMRTPEGRKRVAEAFGKVLEQQIQGRKP